MMTMENKIHIVYVLPEFITEKAAGGLATYYDNIARMLTDAGNKVTVFVLSDVDEVFSYYPGIDVHRVFVDETRVDSMVPSSFMRLWSKGINKAVKRYREAGNNIDLIQYANYLGLGFERMDDIPTVIRISSFQPYMRAAAKYIFDPKTRHKCETAADYLEMLSVIKADAVYSPSSLLKGIINDEIEREVKVIESPFYPKAAHGKSIACEITIGKKYIITFSTLNILKGAKIIGDSINEVLDRNKDVFWVFAGVEVPWTDDNGKTIYPSDYILNNAGENKDRVIFLGKVKHEELLDVVEKAALCVMPSRIDNLPNTCIEAMAMGKVVIGTRDASFDQLIVDEESGFLVERENKKDLIRVIDRALQLEPEQIKNISIKAKKRIEAMKKDKILDEIMTFYVGAINDFNGCAQYSSNKHYVLMKELYNKALRMCGRENIDDYIL